MANDTTSPPQSSDLFGSGLAAVSRSFYLTICVLPIPLRHPVGLAYLLARTSDTIADSTAASPNARIEALRLFGEAIHGTADMPDWEEIIEGVADPSERSLLEQAGTLADLLHASDAADRTDIVRVLDEILRGQTLDARRFAPASSGDLRALSGTAELEDYTYSVAGCVGEFWTRICSRRLSHYSRIDTDEMLRLGISFGKGLQLVNILRDMPADLANGRCYLPANELRDLGLPTDGAALASVLRDRPELVRPVYKRWLALARRHLDDGLRYIEAVRPWRVRLACFLPWVLGVKTLALLDRTPALETPERIKVPRGEVRWLLFWGMLAALSNRFLRRYSARLKKTC